MSEAMAKIAGITRLPLFPLPLVMFPNELLPLHIFEPRYRLMLADLPKQHPFFGVVFFEPSEAFEDRPSLRSVGCVAEVRETELLDDGRSNIITIGLVRFRLLKYVATDDPYLIGEVEFFEDDEEPDEEQLGKLAEIVFGLFERMAKAAFKLSSNRGALPQIQRADPESMSFLISTAFSFDNKHKYHLLETTSTIGRLTELRLLLDRAVIQMENSVDIQKTAKTNGHGRKKLDL